MTIHARQNFDPYTKWAKGSGCLVCGSNVSDEGNKAGVVCVDLGFEIEDQGWAGLCYDCGVQVALAVGYVSRAAVEERAAQMVEMFEQMHAAQEQAAKDASQARLDRDVVERLLGSVYVDPDGEPFGPGVS